jgi:hypothetical protein
MQAKERLRIWKILGIMALLVVLAWLLDGCATLPYAPPYPEYVLEKADPWIKSITHLPESQLQEACGQNYHVLGCANLMTGEIWVIADPDLSACVIRHERSHVYEVFVMGIGVEETRTHKHWHNPYCVRPMRAQGAIGLMARAP